MFCIRTVHEMHADTSRMAMSGGRNSDGINSACNESRKLFPFLVSSHTHSQMGFSAISIQQSNKTLFVYTVHAHTSTENTTCNSCNFIDLDALDVYPLKPVYIQIPFFIIFFVHGGRHDFPHLKVKVQNMQRKKKNFHPFRQFNCVRMF